MKTRIFFIGILLGLSHQIFSQDENGLPKLKQPEGYWGIGYYASGNLGLSNGYLQNSVHPGIGGAIEISYRNPKYNVILNIAESSMYSGSEGTYFEAAEFTAGPRLNSFISRNFFAELTLGTLIVRRVDRFVTMEYNRYPVYKTDPEMGIAATAGIGKEIRIDGSASLLLKLRMLTAYPVRNESFVYLSASGGITINSKNVKGTAVRKLTPIGAGITFMAGKNDPGLLSSGDFGWGSVWGAGISFRISPRTELTLDYESNSIDGINNFINYSQTSKSVCFGGRFYFNKNRITAFTELGGGVYSHKFYASSTGVTAEVKDESKIYPGFNAGTGLAIYLSGYADLILKGNLHFLFSEKKTYAVNYLTAQGGIRFNL